MASEHRTKSVEDLTEAEATAELADLAAAIAANDRAYHEQDAPTITGPLRPEGRRGESRANAITLPLVGRVGVGG